MASETDISDNELPDNAEFGEGTEISPREDDLGEGVDDEDDEAGNDLVDDAELAASQILEHDDEGLEETGAPAPAEVEYEDNVIEPDADLGNFAGDHSGVEV
jgi:hypothetical protein